MLHKNVEFANTNIQSHNTEELNTIITNIIEEGEVVKATQQEKEEKQKKKRPEQDDLDKVMELSYNQTSCANCQYAEMKSNGDCSCKKNILTSDTEIIISVSKVSIPCPAHSEHNRLETRYTNDNRFLFDANDICKKCHREITELTTVKKSCSLCSGQR